MNALLVNFDADTVLWLHRIVIEASSIIQEALIDLGLEDEDPSPEHQDLQIDILMPKVRF